jgi:hypothetical protein
MILKEDKRGLSTIVATIIIIILLLIVAGLILFLVKNKYQCSPSCVEKTCGDDGCGINNNCGICTIGTCNSLGKCFTSCTDTCLSLGYTCGIQSVCENYINCGTCGDGETCQTNGTCMIIPCTDTCLSLGYECGNYTICGENVNCGTCRDGETCQTNGTCIKDICVSNCIGKTCGDDGCGETCGNYTGGCQIDYTCTNGVCTLVLVEDAYYLSPFGNDSTGDGSISKPWFTLNKAWAVIQPGDTVYLRGGTYTYVSRQQLTGKDSTAGNLIKIWAYPGEVPDLTIANPLVLNSWPYALLYFEGDYFHWKGIEISGIPQNPDSTGGEALRVESSSHNIFELFKIHDNGFGWHINAQSTDNLILNCDVYNIYDPYSTSTDPVTGLQVSDPYEDGDGFSIGYDNAGTFNTFRGCRAWNIADDGWDLWRNDGEVLIENCWTWKCGYAEDGISEGGNGQGFKCGISTTTGTNVLVTIRNSVSCYNRQSGYHQNGMLHPVALYNNIAYANGATGYWFHGWSTSEYSYDINHILTNNIAYENLDENAYLTTGSILTTNIFLVNGDNNPAYSVTNADFVSLNGSQLLNPRNPDGSLPEIAFLHLVSESDLINRGTNVGLPSNGIPDLGPFETNY